MSFPLYSSMLSLVKTSRSLTARQKADFVKKVSVLDENGHELIYALIKAYYLEQEENTISNLPYEGQDIQKNISFDLNNFPGRLQQILHKFVAKHLKKIKEEEKKRS